MPLGPSKGPSGFKGCHHMEQRRARSWVSVRCWIPSKEWRRRDLKGMQSAAWSWCIERGQGNLRGFGDWGGEIWNWKLFLGSTIPTICSIPLLPPNINRKAPIKNTFNLAFCLERKGVFGSCCHSRKTCFEQLSAQIIPTGKAPFAEQPLFHQRF